MAGKDSVIIRTTVPRDLYERADQRAKERGNNLSAVLRTLLIGWLHETDPAQPEITPDQATWLRLTEWMNTNGYSKPKEVTTKSEMLKWAKDRGFKG